jgi:large subunit ribosomal protein L24
MKRLKKGDTVKVIAGKEKGNEGKILGFSHKGARVLVEGLNIVKRHTRPTQTNPQGGIVQKEAGIHVSNVMPMTSSGRPTRVQVQVQEDGTKARYSAKHDEILE